MLSAITNYIYKANDLNTLNMASSKVSQWQMINSMTTKRYEHAGVAMIMDKFVVLRGSYGRNDLDLETIETYDNETKQWKDITSKLSGYRPGCSTCFLNNKIRVIGRIEREIIFVRRKV